MKKTHEREFLFESMQAPAQWAACVALLAGQAHVDSSVGDEPCRLSPEYLIGRIKAGFDPFRWSVGRSPNLIHRLIELDDRALFDAALAHIDLQGVVFEKRVAFSIVSAALKNTRQAFAEDLFAAGIAGYDPSLLSPVGGSVTVSRFAAGLDNLKATGTIRGLDALAKACFEKGGDRAQVFLDKDMPVEGDKEACLGIVRGLWRWDNDSELIRRVCERYPLREVIQANDGLQAGSPLPAIAGRPNKSDLEHALSLGLHVDGRDDKGHTGLGLEFERKQSSAAAAAGARKWIAYGADVNAVDGGGKTVLARAIEHGRVESVDALYKAGVNLFARDEKGAVAFTSGAAGAYCEYLLGRSIPGGRNLAMVAVAGSWPEKVREAYANGDDPAHMDDWGYTVVDYALSRTAWHLQNRWQEPAVFQALAEAGVDLNAPLLVKSGDKRVAQHPLHYLVSRCEEASQDIPMVRAYLSAPGVDLDVRDAEGFTPIYRAVKFGNRELVKLLLDAGADTGIRCGRFTLIGQAKDEHIKVLIRSAGTGQGVAASIDAGAVAEIDSTRRRSPSDLSL